MVCFYQGKEEEVPAKHANQRESEGEVTKKRFLSLNYRVRQFLHLCAIEEFYLQRTISGQQKVKALDKANSVKMG